MKALYKQLEYVQADWNPVTMVWDLAFNYNTAPDFESLAANSLQLAWYTGYFDLAGMTKQEKTLFIQGLDIQLAFPPEMNNAVTGDALNIFTIVADTPLSNSSFAFPGFFTGGIDAQNVIFSRCQTWAVTQDGSATSRFMALVNETNSGVCTSTASDRIYYGIAFRVNVVKVGPTTSTVDAVYFPPMRIKLFADVVEEQEYQYLMRLKRSYDLQQSYDVDGRRPH